VTLAQFRARFPEFSTAANTLVSAVLDEAACELDETDLGDAYDAAHGLLTAHKLATSPFGQAARMLNEKGESTYEKSLDGTIRRTITALSVT